MYEQESQIYAGGVRFSEKICSKAEADRKWRRASDEENVSNEENCQKHKPIGITNSGSAAWEDRRGPQTSESQVGATAA